MTASHDNEKPALGRPQMFRYFFFAVLALLLYQLVRIFSPFLTALMWSATLTLIFYPLHERVSRRLKQKHTAALLSTGIVALIVIAPLLLCVWFLVRESASLYPTAKAWVQAASDSGISSTESFLPRPISSLLRKGEGLFAGFNIDLQGLFLKNLGQIGEAIGALGGMVAKNILLLVVNLLVLLLSLFFFFKDGAAVVHWFLEIIPMERAHKEHLAQRLYETVTAVVRGAVLTAASQGLLAGLGFALAGAPVPVFLGFAAAFAALVPPVGPTLIWLPVALYQLTQSKAAGIFLLIWGALVVSTADNFLRPILIGSKAKLPFLLLFFGILGGIQVYGFLGLILGPLLIAMTLAFIQIYREEYHHSKN